MEKSKLEFKIKKDINRQEVSLTSMSLATTKAFLTFLEALTRIAEINSNVSDVKIQVTQGSACVAIEAPTNQFAEIENNVFSAAEHKSTNSEFVDALRDIQKVIQQNGIEYEAYIQKGKTVKPILNLFKETKQFRVVSKKETFPFDVRFLEGKLLEVGGKNPNIHILIKDEKVRVSCTEEQAVLVNRFLYQQIRISAWHSRKGGQSFFSFCDYYTNENLFLDFKNFIQNNIKQGGTEPLKEIHFKIRDFFQDDKFPEAVKFIKLFCHERIDVGRLRSILIISKAFKNHDYLKPMLEKVVALLEDKTDRPLV